MCRSTTQATIATFTSADSTVHGFLTWFSPGVPPQRCAELHRWQRQQLLLGAASGFRSAHVVCFVVEQWMELLGMLGEKHALSMYSYYL